MGRYNWAWNAYDLVIFSVLSFKFADNYVAMLLQQISGILPLPTSNFIMMTVHDNNYYYNIPIMCYCYLYYTLYTTEVGIAVQNMYSHGMHAL